jgi:hypothetical protein
MMNKICAAIVPSYGRPSKRRIVNAAHIDRASACLKVKTDLTARAGKSVPSSVIKYQSAINATLD